MYCKRCGTDNADGMLYCRNCGAPLGGRPDPPDSDSKINTPPYSPNTTPVHAEIPEEYKPISMWGYFGYELLFSIPLIGLILLLVFSFGGTGNINLKNFARSYFCLLIVLVSLVLILGIACGGMLSYYF